MLSNVIVNLLNGTSGGLGLATGTNLFAEQARGDQHVRVGVTTANGDEYISASRKSNVNILVTGWNINDGYVLASKIASLLLGMEGSTFTYNNGSQVETYNIAGMTVRTWPTSFTLVDKVVFTTNIEFFYIQTAV